MILDLNELPTDGLDLRRDIQFDDADTEGDAAWLAGPAQLVARIQPGRRGVEFAGRVEAAARVECSRCLEAFMAPVVGEFRLVVGFEAAEFGSEDQRLDPADADLVYAPGGRLDLREVVREQLGLNLPLKPLCKPDCAGLCPTCGSNRNGIECACRTVQVDPRLAPLSAWKEELSRRAAQGTSGNDDDAESET